MVKIQSDASLPKQMLLLKDTDHEFGGGGGGLGVLWLKPKALKMLGKSSSYSSRPRTVKKSSFILGVCCFPQSRYSGSTY